MSGGNRLLRALAALGSLLMAGCVPFYFKAVNLPTVFGGIHRESNLAYGEDPRQRLDIYLPPPSSRPPPVIVFWYGGGWTAGSKDQYRFVGVALARAGYLAVLPDYRLYPQVRFPAFVDDAARALVWVHAHIADYGGDTGRLYVMGHSAGAHQAAMLAFVPTTLAHVGGDRRWIRGFIGLSGPYGLTPNSPELNAIFTSPYQPADWQPLRSVDAAAPPSVIFHGGADETVSPSNSIDLDAALRRAGVPSQLDLYPGLGHAATVAVLSPFLRWHAPELAAIDQFIRQNDPSH